MARPHTWFRSSQRFILIIPAVITLGAGCAPDASEEEVGLVSSAFTAGSIATTANLKIAFIGDTASGSNLKAVLNLAKNEGAAAVVTAGDMTYNANPGQWWTATESVVGQSFPVFLARGNHDDSSWSG